MGWIGSAVLQVAPKRLPGFWFFQLLWVPIIHLSWIPLRPKPPHFLDILIYIGDPCPLTLIQSCKLICSIIVRNVMIVLKNNGLFLCPNIIHFWTNICIGYRYHVKLISCYYGYEWVMIKSFFCPFEIVLGCGLY